MENFLTWLTTHWTELLSYIGLGAGGAVGAQKLRDKSQDARIKTNSEVISKLNLRLDLMDKQLIQVQNEIKMNSQMDASNKERMNALLEDLREGQKQMHNLLMEVITGKIKLK